MFSNSLLLLGDANKLLTEIETLYNSSLAKKDMPESLPIRIKQTLECIRSSLDYAANAIFHKFCAKKISDEKRKSVERRVYFPVKDDADNFDKEMKTVFVGLTAERPDIVAYLRSVQPFNGLLWLRHFNELCNNNKHRIFSPQIRTETKEVSVSSPNSGRVVWNANSVKFGQGVTILGVPINPNTQMPAYPSQNKVQVNVWVDFIFDELKIPVLQSLRRYYEEALLCISTLSKLVDP